MIKNNYNVNNTLAMQAKIIASLDEEYSKIYELQDN